MEYGSFSRIPFNISRVGLGTAQLANVRGNAGGTKFIPYSEAMLILHRAIEHGINFFDTSGQYGDAESLLGTLAPSLKEKIFIATKAGYLPNGKRNFSPEYLLQQVKQSLHRLRVDRLDLFQLCKPNLQELENGELFSFLDDLKSQNFAKYVGIVVGEPEVGRFCLRKGDLDCIQVMYNLLYLDTYELIQKAHVSNVGVIVRSPLNSGLLSGAYTPNTSFSSSDSRSDYFQGSDFLDRLKRLDHIQSELNISSDELGPFCLNFILSTSEVSVTIPGASTTEQLQTYVSSCNLERFSQTKLHQIMAVAKRHMREYAGPFQNMS